MEKNSFTTKEAFDIIVNVASNDSDFESVDSLDGGWDSDFFYLFFLHSNPENALALGNVQVLPLNDRVK